MKKSPKRNKNYFQTSIIKEGIKILIIISLFN